MQVLDDPGHPSTEGREDGGTKGNPPDAGTVVSVAKAGQFGTYLERS